MMIHKPDHESLAAGRGGGASRDPRRAASAGRPGDVGVAGPEAKPFAATRNACKLCAPLGACLAFRGVEGAVPFLHGSQGCATYIRRYMISHFKEPLDVASSNFGENAAIFGGQENLRTGLANVIRQYSPQLIGIATTCLAETIGDDVGAFLRKIRSEATGPMPELVHVSTPSYAGTHAEGFALTVRAVVETLARECPRHDAINLLPGMVSPADLRYLKAIVRDFGLEAIVLPDYSDTLDAPIWTEYQRIPPGGTSLEAIRRMGGSRATFEFGSGAGSGPSAGRLLAQRFGVPCHELPMPIGVAQTDRFFNLLEEISGRPAPQEHDNERGRLIDAYVDAHKYVFGKRALVYGEQELVMGLAALLVEIGMAPAICATGAASGRLRERIDLLEPDAAGAVTVLEGVDFAAIEEAASSARLDLVLGNSKGYGLARRLEVPLVRVGFPIHDRIDGPRTLHVGYRGAQQLFDRITNSLMENSQDTSPVGYSYL